MFLIPVIKNIFISAEDKRKNKFTKLMMTQEKQFGTLFKRLKNERNRLLEESLQNNAKYEKNGTNKRAIEGENN